MSLSPKQVFLNYINNLNLAIYSDSVLSAVELAKKTDQAAFTDIPNWWRVPGEKTISNEDISIFIKKSATHTPDEDAEQISVTENGKPGSNLGSKQRIKILQECLDNTIEAWKIDPQGGRPVVTDQKSLKAVIAYPLSGSYGKQIADWIGLPPCYPQQAIPRWQQMRKSKCPELVVTITNAGHVTNPHIDNPCLQSDVYHVFGRKLWFIWDDCDHNTTQMMQWSDDYDAIDLDWCYKHLTGLKVCRSISFLPCEIILLTHSLRSFSLVPEERILTLIYTCHRHAGMLLSHFHRQWRCLATYVTPVHSNAAWITGPCMEIITKLQVTWQMI
jgi:hypothetical protein